MAVADLLGFALAALAGHRLRALLSLLGVAIGVTAVVLLTALGQGARAYVVNQFATLGTHLLIVIPGKVETSGGAPGWGGTPHELTLDDAAALARTLPEVARMAPLAMGTETVAAGERQRQVAVLGTTAAFLTVRDLAVAAGSFLPDLPPTRGAPVVVLGQRVARELYPGSDPVGQVVRVGGWRMRVVGLLAPRGVHLGMDMDDVVIVPVATGMRMFNRASLFRVLLKAHPTADLDRLKGRVVALLAERHGEEDITCITQDAVLATFATLLDALTLALVGIAAISLVVAGVGIMNVMLVSVAERTAEVGLLRALGAQPRQVLACFLTEAALLSTAGGLAGLGAGWAGSAVVAHLYPDFPVAPPAWAPPAALGVALAVGTLFGYLPARRATRLDPVAALAGHKR